MTALSYGLNTCWALGASVSLALALPVWTGVAVAEGRDTAQLDRGPNRCIRPEIPEWLLSNRSDPQYTTLLEIEGTTVEAVASAFNVIFLVGSMVVGFAGKEVLQYEWNAIDELVLLSPTTLFYDAGESDYIVDVSLTSDGCVSAISRPAPILYVEPCALWWQLWWEKPWAFCERAQYVYDDTSRTVAVTGYERGSIEEVHLRVYP